MPLTSAQIEDYFASTDDDIRRLLCNILNLNLQNDSSEKCIVSTVNKLLSISKTRLEGLEYLNLLINSCSSGVISEYAITWISYCLVKYPGDNLKELKLCTIGKIIENVYTEPEFTKRFISDYMSKVLEMCISSHANPNETEAGLDTLAICMQRYASWFAPHKVKVETFLVNFLENSSEKLVEKAAIGFHYLQQVGGAGADGVNHKQNFCTNFQKLCATVQKLFDIFFENETEIDQSNRSNLDGFSFVELPYDSQKMIHVTFRRIKNCLKFMLTMMLKGFPVAKEIKPMDILNIITRGTALHHCLSMEKEKSLEDFQFSLLLNKIQVELLRLLRVSIIWFQSNYLPFSYSISKILIDCLNKSQSCSCFKTDSLYHEMVYRVLSDWLRISRNSVHVHFQTQLVTCILRDIIPVKNQVTLSLNTDAPKNKSSKARRKAVQQKIITSGQTSNESLTTTEKCNREKNCLLALETLKHLLIATTLKLKENGLQELYTSIINTIVDIQTLKINYPYTSSACQAAIYEVLVTFYEQETLKVPPIHLALDVLNQGVNDKNRKISITCELGLSILEKLCQPVCPSLYPLEVAVNKNIDDSFSEDELPCNNLLEHNQNALQNGKDIYEQTTEENLEISPAAMEEAVIVKNESHMKALSMDTSIQILDVTVIKTSTSMLTENKEVYNDRGAHSEVDEDHTNEGIYENTGDDPNNLKTEALSTISIHVSDITISEPLTEIVSSIGDVVNEVDIQQSELPSERSETVMRNINNDTSDEPPMKKIKSDDEAEVLKDVEVKEEIISVEDIDDRFEEGDAFVDEIKDF